MKMLLAVLGLLFSLALSASNGTLRFTAADGSYVRLFDAPCSNGTILARVLPQYRANMQSGEIGRKTYAAYWLARPDGQVVVLFDDGEGVVIPMYLFKVETST